MNNNDHEDSERKIRASALRAAIYARVSTDKQEEDGTSLDTQVENCTNYANENDICIVVTLREVFTGSLYRERALLSKMREMARNKEIDCIIINTFDRLSRSQTHLAVLVDEMTHLGIKIECIKEKFDDTAAGQFMRSAMAFVAQVEREKITERTDTGRRKRIREGKIMPGWKPRYGYVWMGEKKERFGLHSEEAQVVKKIFRLYAFEKGTCRSIAKLLSDEGIPSPTGKPAWTDSTVRRILDDPMYTGRGSAFRYDSKQGKEPGKYGSRLRPEEDWLALPEGVVPKIIDEDLFLKVQERLKLNKIESPRNNPDPENAILRCGFIRCGYCGRSMGPGKSANPSRKNPSETNEYRCVHRYRGNRRCPEAPVISIHRIDTAVWEYVGDIVKDFSMVEEAIALAKGEDPNAPNLSGIEHSIKIAQISQDQLIADLKQVDADGQPKMKGRARQIILDDIEKAEQYLSNLEKEKQKVIAGQSDWKRMQEDIEKFTAWCLNAKENYANATYEEKRRALRRFGIQVLVFREDDKEHKRYKIKVKIPDIVRHTS